MTETVTTPKSLPLLQVCADLCAKDVAKDSIAAFVATALSTLSTARVADREQRAVVLYQKAANLAPEKRVKALAILTEVLEA
jgi:hypothetical protein